MINIVILVTSAQFWIDLNDIVNINFESFHIVKWIKKVLCLRENLREIKEEEEKNKKLYENANKCCFRNEQRENRENSVMCNFVLIKTHNAYGVWRMAVRCALCTVTVALIIFLLNGNIAQIFAHTPVRSYIFKLWFFNFKNLWKRIQLRAKIRIKNSYFHFALRTKNRKKKSNV